MPGVNVSFQVQKTSTVSLGKRKHGVQAGKQGSGKQASVTGKPLSDNM